jgi:RNA polymerase sigma factor (sigma-70 family)
MQPPTDSQRPQSTATTPAQLRGDEAELYRRYHAKLVRAVARIVHASDELIEDACQEAWMILVRHQPARSAIFAWLRVVAVHEAYRLCRAEQGAEHLEDIDHDGGWEAIIAGATAIDDVVEARQALALLAELPERQRDDLALLVAGFSYREIAELTGGRTFTNVNKHLAKARARLRLERLRASEGANSRSPSSLTVR